MTQKTHTRGQKRSGVKNYRLNLRLEDEVGERLEAMAEEVSAGAYGPSTLASKMVRDAILAWFKARDTTSIRRR